MKAFSQENAKCYQSDLIHHLIREQDLLKSQGEKCRNSKWKIHSQKPAFLTHTSAPWGFNASFCRPFRFLGNGCMEGEGRLHEVLLNYVKDLWRWFLHAQNWLLIGEESSGAWPPHPLRILHSLLQVRELKGDEDFFFLSDKIPATGSRVDEIF